MTGMPATPPSFAPGEKKGVSNVPVETVVGVALGGMAGLAVLVAAVLFLWRVAGKKRQAKVNRGSGGKVEGDMDQESVWSGCEKGVGVGGNDRG